MSSSNPTGTSDRRRDHEHAALPAAAAALVAAHIPISAAPFLVGAAVEGLAISRARSGLLSSIELVAFGIAILLVFRRVPAFPARRVAFAALAVAVIANLGSAATAGYDLILVLRVFSGAANGLLAAVAYSRIARMPDPEKKYAFCYGFLFASGIVIYLLIPFFAERWLHRGAFGFVGLALAALAPFLARFPGQPETGGRRERPEDGGMPLVTLLLLAAAMLITFSDGLVWPMTERIGTGLGLSGRFVGNTLAAGVLVGLSGTILASRQKAGAATPWPVIAGAWGTALAGLLICAAWSAPWFVAGVLCKNPFYLFLLPLLMARVARADRSGRASALIGGLLPVGAGLGPFPAGLISDRFGFTAVGWTGIGAVAVATVILLIVKPGRKE